MCVDKSLVKYDHTATLIEQRERFIGGSRFHKPAGIPGTNVHLDDKTHIWTTLEWQDESFDMDGNVQPHLGSPVVHMWNWIRDNLP